MFKRTLSALAAVALTAGTVALVTPAHAAETEEVTIVVPIDDLDLKNEKDVARLDRRVRKAARQICGDVPTLEVLMRTLVIGCHDQVLANARADVETAIATARTSPDRLALRTR